MASSNNKWLIHTLLVGLIPVNARLLMWASTATGQVAPLAASDFITLGLVVQISILNEGAHLLMREQAARALLNSICTLFITCYGVLYTLIVFSEHNMELIDVPFVLTMSLLLCFGSALFGLILFQMIKRRQ